MGRKQSAYEHAIQTFDESTDYTVFCWTEPHRLYHRKYPQFAKVFKEKNICGCSRLLWNAHDYAYSERRQARELYWFDHEVLSKYKGIALHCWSFEQTYNFKQGIVFETPLISLTTRS